MKKIFILICLFTCSYAYSFPKFIENILFGSLYLDNSELNFKDDKSIRVLENNSVVGFFKVQKNNSIVENKIVTEGFFYNLNWELNEKFYFACLSSEDCKFFSLDEYEEMIGYLTQK